MQHFSPENETLKMQIILWKQQRYMQSRLILVSLIPNQQTYLKCGKCLGKKNKL